MLRISCRNFRYIEISNVSCIEGVTGGGKQEVGPPLPRPESIPVLRFFFYCETLTQDEDGVYSECRLVILDSVTAVLSPLLGGVKNPAGEEKRKRLVNDSNTSARTCGKKSWSEPELRGSMGLGSRGRTVGGE